MLRGFWGFSSEHLLLFALIWSFIVKLMHSLISRHKTCFPRSKFLLIRMLQIIKLKAIQPAQYKRNQYHFNVLYDMKPTTANAPNFPAPPNPLLLFPETKSVPWKLRASWPNGEKKWGNSSTNSIWKKTLNLAAWRKNNANRSDQTE